MGQLLNKPRPVLVRPAAPPTDNTPTRTPFGVGVWLKSVLGLMISLVGAILSDLPGLLKYVLAFGLWGG